MLTQTLKLGATSRAELLYKVQSWKKPKDKSFTVTKLYRYWYGVQSKNRNTCTFTVEFFSAAKEGKYLIPTEKVGTLQGCSRRKHGGNINQRIILTGKK